MRAGGLVPEQLLERGQVGLEGGLDDVRREAVAGDRVRGALRVDGAAGADHDLALGVLAAGDGPDLVVGQAREPADERLDGRVDGAEERVHGTVALGLGADRLAVHDERDVAARAAALAGADGPALEADRGVGDGVRGRAGGRRLGLDERDEVRVGDLLLGIGQGDGLAVDAVERLALEVEARARGACPAGRDGRRACRPRGASRRGPPTAAS